MVKRQATTWSKNLVRTKKVIKVRKINEKHDILTVEEKRIPFIGNKTKRSLETNPKKRELEAIRLKASKIRIKKRIEKEKELF